MNVASWLMGMSGVLYLSCLALPAYLPLYSANAERYFGIFAFLLGPIGLFAGHYSWLANVALLAAWIRYSNNNPKSGIAWCVTSLALALSFLVEKTIAVGSAGDYPFEILSGYWVWLASIVFAGMSLIVSMFNLERHEQIVAEPSSESDTDTSRQSTS